MYKQIHLQHNPFQPQYLRHFIEDDSHNNNNQITTGVNSFIKQYNRLLVANEQAARFIRANNNYSFFILHYRELISIQPLTCLTAGLSRLRRLQVDFTINSRILVWKAIQLTQQMTEIRIRPEISFSDSYVFMCG